jgi:uncharacterized protein YacL
MLLTILRGLFMCLVLGVATGFAARAAQDNLVEDADSLRRLIPFGIFFGVILGGVLVIAADIRLKNKQITTFSAVYAGLLIGLTLAYLLSLALRPILETYFSREYLQLTQILLTVLFSYMCVSTLLQTKDHFRFIIPFVEFSKQVKGVKAIVLDTSVIIDGRIADICDTRFIDTKLVVPRFVLQELQAIADSSDRLKRNRGRRGMDVLKRMQTNPKVELEIHEGSLPELEEVREVDQRIVLLAKALGARVMTNDFNLNELANAVKAVALPGEHLTIRVVKPGDQIGQGIGYLDDGTMVVAEQGRNFLGQEVILCVTSVLQKPEGRMIFGRVEGKAPATAAAPAAATAAKEGS